MRFFSPLLILAALLAAACGGAAVFPEVFSQERADGKIPVSIELIKKQTRKEIDGMPEKQATAERWRDIEADYNDCRVSSARKTKAEADKVFADCMSRKGYVYMLRLDAEQLHDEIAAAEPAKYAAEKKAEEKARIAAEKRRKEKVAAAERRRKAKRLAAEKKAEQEKKDFNLRNWVFDGDVAEIRAWLSTGANPNAATKDGTTALMIASQEGYPEIAKILLAAGANPNAAEDDGTTALMFSAIKNHSEVVKILLAAGANPDAMEDDGMTALLWAAQEGHSEVVKALLAAGAHPNRKTNDGVTALMWAAQEKHFEIVKMLLAAGANPNAARDDGKTVLMSAAKNNHSEVVKMLLAAGANPNGALGDGLTTLMGVAKLGYAEIVKMLLAAGAHPNGKTNGGLTALMFATFTDKAEVVKVLLACGASPNIKSKSVTVWDIAEDRPLILPILKEYKAAIDAGGRPQSCKTKTAITATTPKTVNPAAQVFENSWRSIVVVRQGENQGSGIIVRPNVVATNCHVIDSDGKIVIYKHDNRRATTDTTYNAVIQKRDIARDFCLLNVVGLQGTPAKLRRYDTLDIGEDVYAVGSPRGLDLSLSSGIISQLRQGTNTRYIQTDASVSPGSSGGGLFDSGGNLIGILTSKIADEDVEGIGFAIPADLADNL